MLTRTATRAALITVIALVLGASFAMAQDEERITIRFWHIFGSVTWLPEEVEADFEAMFPQYDLELRVLDNYNSVVDLNTLAQEQGDPPEVVQIFEAGTQEVRDSGFFKSIEEAIGDRTEINGLPVVLDDIFEPVGAYYQVDGEYFSLPWNTSTPLIYANMDLLVEAGLAEDVEDVDAIPETWAEVEAACAVIVENTDADCINWSFSSWYFEQTMGQMGELLVNNDNGRSGRATETLVNNANAVAYMEYWNRLEDAGYFVTYDSGEFGPAFGGGQLALNISSSASARGRVNAGEENGFTVRAGRMPYNQDVEYVGNLIGGATLYLTDGLDPEVEEGALTFMLFLLTPENAAEWHQVTGYVPIRQAGFDFLVEQDWFEENPTFAVANQQFDAVTVTPASTGALFGTFLPTRELLSDAFQEILFNDADPQATLDRVKAEADLLLEEYNLLVVGE